MLAVSYEGREVAIINTQCGDKLLVSDTEKIMKEMPVGVEDSKVEWRRVRDRVVLRTPTVCSSY